MPRKEESPPAKRRVSASCTDEPKEGEGEERPTGTEALMYEKLKLGGGFGCKLCHEKYSHRYKVKRHIRTKHAPREAPESRYQLSVHGNEHRENCGGNVFGCDKCEYRAKSKQYLKIHEIRRHTTARNFECDHCGKRFKMKTDLKFHLGTHGDSEHMCDVCGRMYTSRDSLRKHRRVVHVNEYKFRCGLCHQKLLTEANFRAHMESHEKLHGCDECDLEFMNKYYVTRHKRRVHELERTNLCPVCGKAFVCRATLRVHCLTHAKVKPYRCNVCGYGFTHRSSMMLHWRRKHPEAEEAPPPVILANFLEAIETGENSPGSRSRYNPKSPD